MKPREDIVGVILSREEASQALLFDEAAHDLEPRDRSITEYLLAQPIGLDLQSNTTEFPLDDVQTRRLWQVAFWAATKYLETYKEVSNLHEEIITSQDIGRVIITEYLFTLEVELKVAADTYTKTKQFALAIDSAFDYSRSQLLNETSSKVQPSI